MKYDKRCLACYGVAEPTSRPYHPACSRRLFGKAEPPAIPYALNELEKLAEQIVRSQVAVPGVQEKLSLHLDRSGGGPGRLTLVGLWGHFILKPPVSAYPQMPQIEDLTMHLASLFKIATVPHALIPLKSGELAYITRRIDRGKQKEKLHMEDMCQLTERLSEDKYRGSMEQIGKAILAFSSNPVLDVLRFYELTLFSFLTGNGDMHLKNFSLLWRKDKMIVLAPAYDLLSTRLLISEKDDPEEMALTLNGKKSSLNPGDFLAFAGNLGLNSKQRENIWRKFRRALPEAIAFLDRAFITAEKRDEFKNLLTTRASALELRESG